VTTRESWIRFNKATHALPSSCCLWPTTRFVNSPRRGYEGLKKREDKIPPESKHELAAALERLVQLYEATGNADEAAKWRQELEAAKAAAQPVAGS
jgi:hypothetical protein